MCGRNNAIECLLLLGEERAHLEEGVQNLPQHRSTQRLLDAQHRLGTLLHPLHLLALEIRDVGPVAGGREEGERRGREDEGSDVSMGAKRGCGAQSGRG